jgi:threonine synthase
MRLTSTSGNGGTVSFEEALHRGIAPDGGLYFPVTIPPVPVGFVEGMAHRSFVEIAFEVARCALGGEIPDNDLMRIVHDAFSFPVPLHQLEERTGVLELFHGPTLAFKDFGARFMARAVRHFGRHEDVERTVLVATSGDTGSAVAHGFAGVPGIRVVLLYPGGRVSRTQELQLTTVGGNVTALEIAGTFDDCQRLVKRAFADPELSTRRRLTSANSINIGRLLPQAFYYFEAIARKPVDMPAVISVPCGNLGNLTGGLIARAMGLPVHHFCAATNVNRVMVDYLETGVFTPAEAKETISNAMDVGNPGNLPRIVRMFNGDLGAMRSVIESTSIMDDETRRTITQVYARTGYVLDPHGAVGYAALVRSRRLSETYGIVLETAHPAKFLETLDPSLRAVVEMPARLRETLAKKKVSIRMTNSFDDLKAFLLST